VTISELKEKAAAIRRGEYEHCAVDERVNLIVAVADLAGKVSAVTWEPGDKEKAFAILADLQCDTLTEVSKPTAGWESGSVDNSNPHYLKKN